MWSGSGGSTFYYNAKTVDECGTINGVTSYAETGASLSTIAERGTNKLVAIANEVLKADMSLCGKKIQITHTTTKKVYSDLFVWDGCAACNSDPHIDMSDIEFATIYGEDRCSEGEIKNEITWEV
ncbi:hypothetical protein RQP46_002503 [Phenoliferia psychrophenolica]